MGQVLTLRRRKLNKEDLLRMRLPKRYWNVGYDLISDYSDEELSESPRDALVDYIKNMDDMRSSGLGLLLWGPNGTGKTSMAALVAKEFRRRFQTVLFIEAANLKGLVAGREHFDEDQTYWQRAMNVDVLVLDDLGKGVSDSKGFGRNLIDELIRTRNANKLITIITTNVVLSGRGETLSSIVKASTMHSLKEHVVPIFVRGRDLRDRSGTESIRLTAD